MRVCSSAPQVDDVKMTMEENVNAMLKQHEKLEDLEDKADTMRCEASKFKKGAGQLASKMWWQNARLMCIIAIIAIIVLVIIIFSICEPCRPGKRRALQSNAETHSELGTRRAASYSAHYMDSLQKHAAEAAHALVIKSLPQLKVRGLYNA